MPYIDTKYISDCNYCRHHRTGSCDTWCDCGECFEPDMMQIPLADVMEVVHAEWVSDFCDYDPYCPVCKEPAISYINHTSGSEHYYRTNFCPNCGAKMDGKRKDNVNNV